LHLVIEKSRSKEIIKLFHYTVNPYS